jgi:hypothetical protein
MGDGEAAFAAPKHAAAPDHISAYIPRAVYHDSPRSRVAVAGVETLETYRVAVGTYIRGVGSKGKARGPWSAWWMRTRPLARSVPETGERTLQGAVREPELA